MFSKPEDTGIIELVDCLQNCRQVGSLDEWYFLSYSIAVDFDILIHDLFLWFDDPYRY